MRFPKRVLYFGLLLWLIPFLVSVLIFPLKRNGSPLFETIMPLVVVTSAMWFVNLHFRRCHCPTLQECLLIGIVWAVISLALDLALFMWGPMKMTLPDYMADIGLAYLVFPILTVGCGRLNRTALPANRIDWSASSH